MLDLLRQLVAVAELRKSVRQSNEEYFADPAKRIAYATDEGMAREPSHPEPEALSWTYHDRFPTKSIRTGTKPAQQVEWLQEERGDANDEDPGRGDALWSGAAKDRPGWTPLVVYQDPAGKHHVWDGNHRLAGAHEEGLSDVPVLLGQRHPSKPTLRRPKP